MTHHPLSKTVGVFGNSVELNTSFLNASCKALGGKKLSPETLLFFVAPASGAKTIDEMMRNNIYVYSYPVFKDHAALNVSYNFSVAIIVDDGTVEDTNERLTVSSWRKFIRSKQEVHEKSEDTIFLKRIGARIEGPYRTMEIVVVKIDNNSVSGNVDQDGTIYVNVDTGSNATLPYRMFYDAK